MIEYVFSFTTTADSMLAEDLLLEAKLSVRIMPTPSSIKAGCGLSLRIDEHQLASANTILTTSNMKFDIHKKIQDNRNGIYYEKQQ